MKKSLTRTISVLLVLLMTVGIMTVSVTTSSAIAYYLRVYPGESKLTPGTQQRGSHPHTGYTVEAGETIRIDISTASSYKYFYYQFDEKVISVECAYTSSTYVTFLVTGVSPGTTYFNCAENGYYPASKYDPFRYDFSLGVDGGGYPGPFSDYEITVKPSSSAPSTPSTPTVTTPSAAAPTNVTMYNHDTGLHVDWYKAANASRYIVYYRPSWSSSWSNITTSGTYCNLTGLTPGTLYYVQVRSVNSAGVNGGISSAKIFTHVRGTTLNSTVYNSNGSVTLSWSVADGANGYAVAKKRSTDKSYTYYYTTSTSYNDKNVVGGAVYYYQIRPYYSNGKSAAYAEWSNAKSITTLFKPTITNMNINASRLNINWNKISGAKSYKVAFKRASDSAWNYRTVTTNYYNVTNPTANAVYYVQVCPLNGSVAGPYSAAKSISLATLAKPVLSGDANGSRNYLSWNSVSGAKSYQIAKKTTQQSSYTYLTTTSTSYLDYSFTDGKTYTYQVRAYNGSTYGPWSNVATLRPPVDTPIIYLAESYSNRIQAEWYDVEGASYYRVAYRKSTDSSWSYTTIYDSEFDLYYPTANAKYYVSVYAVGENGTKSDWSDDAIIYT